METADTRASAPLLEREEELARLDSALESAEQGAGSVLLVEGPPGIGKTSLLAEIRARGAERDARALSARGDRLEHEFGFGVVRSLFERELPGSGSGTGSGSGSVRAELLGGAAEIGAAALGLGSTPELGGTGAQAALHGLYWLVADLAESAPLLILIDDVQWADDASIRFLRYLGSRLEGVQALVVLATRTTGAAHDGPLEELRQHLNPATIRLAPLSERASGLLARAALAGPVSEELCAACHRATGGNPFFLEELLAEIGNDGPPPSPESVDVIGPERVADSVLSRIRRLDATAYDLAAALAVLGPEAQLRHAATLAGLEIDVAGRIADRLALADVLLTAWPVGFVHPIVRAAIYERLPSAEKSRLHRHAASILAEDGTAAELLAPHLLATEPAADPETVTWLRTAAQAAREGRSGDGRALPAASHRRASPGTGARRCPARSGRR